jgi:multidrug efflux pump subunit AcrA (membrane-fusion protein)
MNQAQPSVPPTPTSPDVVIADGGNFIHIGQTVRQAQLSALAATRQSLENARNVVQAQSHRLSMNSANRAQIDQQIAQIDQQIATIDQTIAGAQSDASPEPWQIISPPPASVPERMWPKDLAMLSGVFIVCVLLPLAVAVSLRILRRGAAKVASLPSDIAERLGRMESAIEATAIEVERIGEGQRYLTRVLGDRKPEELLERPRPVAPYKTITPH